jgi:predicted PurR-regulated permease PerM
MDEKTMKIVERSFEVFLLASLVGLFFYLIWPFMFSLLLAATFVFVFYKIYLAVKKIFRFESFSTAIVLIFVLFLIMVPLFFIVEELVNQITLIVKENYYFFDGTYLESCESGVCTTIKNNTAFIQNQLEIFLEKSLEHVTSGFTAIFSSVTMLLLNIFIFITAFFFFMKDGHKFSRYVKRIIPMRMEYKEALLLRFKDTLSAIFFSYILVGIVQGTLMGLLLYLLGFETWLLLGLITAFLSMIPFSGPYLVWIPLSVYLALKGDYITAGVLLVVGFVVVSSSEDFLRPLFIKDKVKVNFLLVFLAILGGIYAFGLAGLFLGPLIVSMLISVITLYKLDFR